ncbi:hypothetical protein AXA44_36365 [Rhodococcus sp. SC4]|nr:hypothetical protein AXA44_36365 [Rhodococcus sp. SC4]
MTVSLEVVVVAPMRVIIVSRLSRRALPHRLLERRGVGDDIVRVAALTTPTVITAPSDMVCNEAIISASATTGSFAVCGMEPCPPAPTW